MTESLPLNPVRTQLGKTTALVKQLEEALAECDRLKKENEKLRKELNSAVMHLVETKRQSPSADMKRKLSDLENSIETKRQGRGRDAHYVATCPLCEFSHSVDVLSSNQSAEVAATNAVRGHLKNAHKDEVDGDV